MSGYHGAALFFCLSGLVTAARAQPGFEAAFARMPVTEELSWEHAMLQRILLAVDHLLENMDVSTDLSPVCEASELIKRFVEQRHMTFEEDNVYPLFSTGELADLAEAFVSQHREARKINGRICDLTSTGNIRDRSEAERLRLLFDEYKVLMTAHAAREETLLFPAIVSTLSREDLDELKKRNERHGRDLLGRDAMEKLYRQLADIEGSCGITGLESYTRRLKQSHFSC